jgi:thiamine-phosphate pyrophosphorylase
MRSLLDCHLYGIVDLGYVRVDRVRWVTQQLVDGGIDLLQLRAKNLPKNAIPELAETMLQVTEPAQVPLILNDYPDLLKEVPAQGCHVGQEDHTVAEARVLAGRSCLVGISTHTLAQARIAEAEGADYLGFGPIFATATKPSASPIGLESVGEAAGTVRVPVFCIGGIRAGNLQEVIAAGTSRVCIVSDLLLAKNITEHTRTLKRLLLEGAEIRR